MGGYAWWIHFNKSHDNTQLWRLRLQPNKEGLRDSLNNQGWNWKVCCCFAIAKLGASARRRQQSLGRYQQGVWRRAAPQASSVWGPLTMLLCSEIRACWLWDHDNCLWLNIRAIYLQERLQIKRRNSALPNEFVWARNQGRHVLYSGTTASYRQVVHYETNPVLKRKKVLFRAKVCWERPLETIRALNQACHSSPWVSALVNMSSLRKRDDFCKSRTVWKNILAVLYLWSRKSQPLSNALLWTGKR